MEHIRVLIPVSIFSLVIGYHLGKYTLSNNQVKVVKNVSSEEILIKLEDDDEEEEEDDIVEINSLSHNGIEGEVKMALVVRQDLEMTKGKIAAQCCHAAVTCYRLMTSNPNSASYNPCMMNRWLNGGQTKITLKCPNKDLMDELFAHAIDLGVNAYVVHDAGRTQVVAGSATVLGLGPAPKMILDQITKELKLY